MKIEIGKLMSQFSCLGPQPTLKYPIADALIQKEKEPSFVPSLIIFMKEWIKLQSELRTVARKKKAEKFSEEFAPEFIALDTLTPTDPSEEEDEGEDQEDLHSFLIELVEAQPDEVNNANEENLDGSGQIVDDGATSANEGDS